MEDQYVIFSIFLSYKAFNLALSIDLCHDYPCNCYRSTNCLVGTHGEHDFYFTLNKILIELSLPHIAYFLSGGCRIVLLMRGPQKFTLHLWALH